MCAGAHREGPELRIFTQRRPREPSFNHLGSGGSSRSMRRPMVPQVISALLAFLFLSDAAQAHDIYTHLKSRSGKSCCDNSDCRPAPYRITSSGVEMLVGEHGLGCLVGSSSTACWRATPERLGWPLVRRAV